MLVLPSKTLFGSVAVIIVEDLFPGVHKAQLLPGDLLHQLLIVTVFNILGKGGVLLPFLLHLRGKLFLVRLGSLDFSLQPVELHTQSQEKRQNQQLG